MRQPLNSSSRKNDLEEDWNCNEHTSTKSQLFLFFGTSHSCCCLFGYIGVKDLCRHLFSPVNSSASHIMASNYHFLFIPTFLRCARSLCRRRNQF